MGPAVINLATGALLAIDYNVRQRDIACLLVSSKVCLQTGFHGLNDAFLSHQSASEVHEKTHAKGGSYFSVFLLLLFFLFSFFVLLLFSAVFIFNFNSNNRMQVSAS